MDKSVHNEQLKLLANWMNAVSVTVIGAGGLLPLLSMYFGVGTPIRDEWMLWPMVSICAGVATSLHSLGAFFLEGLTDG